MSETREERREERREAAATRRRWVTLAEVIAVAGVVIAALGLWATWSDRRAEEADRAATTTAEQRDRARLEIVGEVRGGGDSILLKDERHDIRDVRFAFPPALGVPAQAPAGDPAIAAEWFARPLLKLTDGGADEQVGRLPVLATITYWDGDRARTATQTFDIVWRTGGRFLRGRSLKIEGLRLRARGGTVATLDRVWQRPER